MRAALALARRGLGRVWPNPAVGCILAKGSAVIARGWTQAGGRPHAEAEALARAGALAEGATVFVTLEPCAHHGKTPPCARALADAGVVRAVIACRDPDPRVEGKGIQMLESAGIEVLEGVAEEEARELNGGYFSCVEHGRPLVTLKVASSLDGRIATGRGESHWVTGEAARARAHALRASHDAIAVGSGTMLADDPELTCRLPGLGARSPVRVVFDGRLRTPLTGKFVVTARQRPAWIITLSGGDAVRSEAVREVGVEVIEVAAGSSGSPDPAKALQALAERGITRLLVEGGRYLAAALLRARLVDRLVWFRAPSWIGGDGTPAAEALGVDSLAEVPRFQRTGTESVGADLMETYRTEQDR